MTNAEKYADKIDIAMPIERLTEKCENCPLNNTCRKQEQIKERLLSEANQGGEKNE